LPRKPYYAPDRECSADDPQPIIEIKLNDGEIITDSTLDIKGSATADKGFKKWVLEYGLGVDPAAWTVLSESDKPVKNSILYSWDLSNEPNGIISLRLTLIGDKAEVEKRVRLNLDLLIPTEPPPPPTETLAPTFTPTMTPTFEIIIPTETPTPSETPTEMPTAIP